MAGDLDSFPEPSDRRPYWSERQESASGRQVLTLASVARGFVQIVSSLGDRGYFDEAFGKDCVDDPSLINPNALIETRIGEPDLWPLRATRLAENRNVFYDVVEVLHDLVACPRYGHIHSYAGCGWHYSEFSRHTGRRRRSSPSPRRCSD